MLTTTISSDMLSYWDSIMKLRHSFDSDNLDDEIKATVELQAPNHLFLIKMEIKKLAQETNRVIDLRKYFKNVCEPIEIGGVKHFLDEASYALLKSEYVSYNNKLTVGAVEVLMIDVKHRYKNLSLSKDLIKIPSAEIRSLTKCYQREHERLFLTKKTKMFICSPSLINNANFSKLEIEGIATNLSKTGISIRFKKEEFENLIKTDLLNSNVFIRLTEIEREYKFNNKLEIYCNVVRETVKDNDVYLMLSFNNTKNKEEFKEFDSFIDGYINSQKGKNKIDSKNVEESIAVKINEQFIMTRMNTLPVFFSKNNEIWEVKAQLFTANNKEIGIISNKKDNKGFLSSLTKLDYIQDCLNKNDFFNCYLFIFPLKTKTGKIHYFAIPDKVLFKSPYLINLAQRADLNNFLKCYKLEGSVINPEEESKIISSIPSSINVNPYNIIKEPIGMAKRLANSLERLIVFSEQTNTLKTLKVLYTDKEDNNFDFSKIEQFLLREPKRIPHIYESKLEVSDLRTEDRFNNALNVTVINKNDPQNKSYVYMGQTENLSTKGLKIILEKEADFPLKSELLVTLKVGDNPIFENEPYQIVGKENPQVFRLYISGALRNHEGRKKLSRFIYRNMDNLTPTGVDTEIFGLSRLLRNIWAHNIKPNYGIISRIESKRFVSTIVASESYGYLNLDKTLSAKDSVLNLVKLEPFRTAIEKKESVINKDNPYEIFHIALISKKKSDNYNYYLTKFIDDINIKTFLNIKNIKNIEDLKILKIQVTKKGRVLNKYFNEELLYLKSISSSKLVFLEKMIRDTTGIVEINDITDLIDLV